MISAVNLCSSLNNNYEKCESYISNINLIFFKKIDLIDLLLISLIFFIVTFFLTKNINDKYNKVKNYIISFNIFILFSTIYFFPINLPFGDIWEEYQMVSNNNLVDYLFSVNWSGHNFLTTRIIFYLINEHLNLNLVYIHIISLFLYCLSIFIFFKFLDKNKSKYFIVLLPLLFSGKWFNHIFETINFVWVFNFFLTIVIIYYLNLKGNFKFIQISLILFIQLMSFTGGYFILIYLIIYLIFNEKINIKNKVSILLILISILFLSNYLIPTFSENTPYIMTDLKRFISSIKISQIIISFLGMISSIYLPYVFLKIDVIKNVSILLGFVQLTVLYIILIKSKINLKKFIIENPFLIIGIISCLIISIARIDRFGELRYTTYSIIFQPGWNTQNKQIVILPNFSTYID